ncbi:MAG: hypothetical protein QOI38_1537 [Sphingomonadales bacterium]|jgi:hypothetical protein|nr:hypothetical protein [Sphingomonadales bacterium]
MTLVLCENGDASALWAADRLRQRGASVAIVDAPTLGAATRWEHRVDASSASVSVTLVDGRTLSSDRPAPILNRLTFIPLGGLRSIAGRDYGYAVQEMFALFLSWLHAWPAPVINRPAPQGLCGNFRHPSVWATLGAQAGFATRAWTQGSDDPADDAWLPQPAEATAFVVAGRVLLPPVLPSDLEAACRRLGALCGTALIGVDFARDGDGGWAMIGATPIPNLMLGGEPLIDALLEAIAA